MIAEMIVLASIFTYAAVALMLTKNPQLIYGRKKPKFRAPHISHRGGAAERLENTLAAFDHAVKDCRTDMLELDCHLTKDEKVVVVHDANLFRLTGVDVNISDVNYDDLPPLRDKLRVTFSPADCVDVHAIGKNQVLAEVKRICLLEDVFRRYPDTAVNLDVKVNDDRLIERIATLIREYKRESITVWGNLNWQICEKCYRLAPEIPLIFSVRRVMKTVGLFYLGLLPFFKIDEQFFEVPAVSIMLAAYEQHKAMSSKSDDNDDGQSIHFEISWKFRIIAQVANTLLMRRSLIEHLQKRGIATFVWVLNDDSAFEQAFRHLRVDGIMTDKPTALRRFLNQHPEMLARLCKSN